MARKKKTNNYRLILQWTIIVLLVYLIVRPLVDRSYIADFEAYCPFGGLQALSSFLANNSLACSMTTTQIAMGLALLAGVFLFSKLFCSYICPIGIFTEWLGRIGKRFKMNFVITGPADRLLRVLKYAILFVTFYFSVSSSELFCKTFDPYYAVFSGFGSDVVMGYAVMALLLAIPGSFFIRQFWCKYICPLSAASNIFSFGFVFLGIVGVYALLTAGFGLQIGWIWLLGALSMAGVVLETTRLKFGIFPIVKVTRNAETCTSCRLCDKACPMAIRISDIPKVEHIDCHLCGDCVSSCPEPETLQFNKRKINWLPAAATVGLVILGLAFASVTDIPTISLKWGSSGQMENAAIFRQSGLKSVKCFGSSMSFANHMKELSGVLGVEAFVSDNSVKVYYDPAVTNEMEIKEFIFTPVSRVVAAPADGLKQITISEFAVDKFFDPSDAGLLAIKLGQKPGVLAFETMFGEPVHTFVFYDSSLVSAGEISKLIEEKKVKWEIDGEPGEATTGFKVASVDPRPALSLKGYLEKMYEPVKMTFNGFEDYDSVQTAEILLPFSAAAEPSLADMPWYLLSHISNNRGVIKFEIQTTDSGFVLSLIYVPEITTREQVMIQLNEPQLKVHLSDGSEQKLENPFRF
ncbi:MAG TPA: 4Fe-4S binding protein [Lentimicrobium sp.]|nr:4Fe-4S binding protein [Lentimicrobium sp.]